MTKQYPISTWINIRLERSSHSDWNMVKMSRFNWGFKTIRLPIGQTYTIGLHLRGFFWGQWGFAKLIQGEI